MIAASVESIRELGIIADNKFKFDKHMEEIAEKASGVVNKDTLNVLYKSLVRPILEYCAPVCNPFTRFFYKKLVYKKLVLRWPKF